jgi:hypothetical protein
VEPGRRGDARAGRAPAGVRMESLFQALAALAHAGKLNREGFPTPLRGAVLAREFAAEIAPAHDPEMPFDRLPLRLLDGLLIALAVVGRLLGYRIRETTEARRGRSELVASREGAVRAARLVPPADRRVQQEQREDGEPEAAGREPLPLCTPPPPAHEQLRHVEAPRARIGAAARRDADRAGLRSVRNSRHDLRIRRDV